MKKLFEICTASAMLLSLSFPVLATIIRINVGPAGVPDETQPRVNVGDAPAGYGPNSWQGPVAGLGNKTNWHARYLADGNALSTLFPGEAASLTVKDLAGISYYTKRPSSLSTGQDWWVQIYTRPTGAGDNRSWYHDRFINDYNNHTNTGAWVQYSTSGTDPMMFHSNGLGRTGAFTLAALGNEKDASGSNIGDQLVEMISVQTASNWDGFDGYMDGLKITLKSGNIGQVNFGVPEPAALTLVGLGLAGIGFSRRRSNKHHHQANIRGHD